MNLMSQLATAINSWEIIVFVFLVGGAFLLGLILGRARIFLLLLSSYISFAIMNFVPIKKILPSIFAKEENFVLLIVGFLVLIGLIYFLLSRTTHSKTIKKGGVGSAFYIFFISLFFVGIVINVVFSFFPKDLLSEFSSTTSAVFNNNLSRIIWIAVPLIFIGIFRRKS